ncbi:MAG: hypothetical protein V3W28_04765 [Thermoplasmata archaeon]
MADVARPFLLALSLLVTASFSLPSPVSGGSDELLKPGDYAVYTIGSCGAGDVWFYSPFYGFEETENPYDQVQIWVRACSVRLRWNVTAVNDGIAEISLEMRGWYYWEGYRDGEWFITMGVGPYYWRPDTDDPIFHEINATLNAKHTLRVDLSTMDVTSEDGTYLGRWIFLITAEEVIAGQEQILRRWYNETVVTANVTVLNDLDGPSEVGFEALYDTETFVSSRTRLDEPFPEGLDRYLYSLGGGWKTLLRASPLYHPGASLLLTNTGRHYNDVLFNLYGLILIDGWISVPDAYPSTMTLVDTNLIDLPDDDADGLPNTWEVLDYDPKIWEATPDEDGGGNGDADGEDPGDGEGPGEGDGTNGDGGGETPSAWGIPWTTIGLLAAIAVVAVIVVLRDLLGPGRRRGG